MSDQGLRFSVILPVCNRETTVLRALRDCLPQGHPRLVAVVIEERRPMGPLRCWLRLRIRGFESRPTLRTVGSARPGRSRGLPERDRNHDRGGVLLPRGSRDRLQTAFRWPRQGVRSRLMSNYGPACHLGYRITLLTRANADGRNGKYHMPQPPLHPELLTESALKDQRRRS